MDLVAARPSKLTCPGKSPVRSVLEDKTVATALAGEFVRETLAKGEGAFKKADHIDLIPGPGRHVRTKGIARPGDWAHGRHGRSCDGSLSGRRLVEKEAFR